MRRVAAGVEIRDDDDAVEHFDGVVVATHPHQALAHAEPTRPPLERDVLGAHRLHRNPTVLHTDTSVLPRAPRAQASWNYAMPSCDALPDRGAAQLQHEPPAAA